MNTVSVKAIEWLNSGEYLTEIDEMRTTITSYRRKQKGKSMQKREERLMHSGVFLLLQRLSQTRREKKDAAPVEKK